MPGPESSSYHNLHWVVAIITNIGVGSLDSSFECGRLNLASPRGILVPKLQRHLFCLPCLGWPWEHRPGGDFNKETGKPRGRRKVQEKRGRYERTWGGNRVDGQAAWWRGASECVWELNRYLLGRKGLMDPCDLWVFLQPGIEPGPWWWKCLSPNQWNAREFPRYLSKLFIYLFIFGCTGSLLLLRLLWLQPAGATLLCGMQALHCYAFSCCGAQALDCWLSSLWYTGLVVLHHVGSSQIRDWTHVSCIGRWILCHWATREAP